MLGLTRISIRTVHSRATSAATRSKTHSWQLCCRTDAIRFYSKTHSSPPARSKPTPPPPTVKKTTFTHGDTSRAPKPSTTRNMITFLTASALGVGAYIYQLQKHRSTDIFKNPFSSPETLTNEKWTPILLKKITPVSEHTSLFDFELEHPCSIPISSAIYVKDDEIQAMRAYTPVHSTEQDQSSFQLLIKRYSEGQVSRFMHSARPGQKIEMRGPVVIWPGNRSDLEQWDEIGMIAGGTGITAVLPIIHSALGHPDKKIKISLLFAAQSQEELYFKDELDQLAKTFHDQFKVSYAIDKLPGGSAVGTGEVTAWKGHVGFVNQDMLLGLLPAPQELSSEDNRNKETKRSIVLVCGPEVMVKHVAGSRGMSGQEPVRGVLGAMGYKRDQVFRFPN
ncbi:hypothetical protein BGZ83_006620 [Gryganskiella cystojenkinii]|nr:hypothetical protein BGZ83_006620 [Gryganskiella cystojenkinii]